MSIYTPTYIAGYQLTYNPQSLVWNTPNDLVEQRLTGRGNSVIFFGGVFADVITFDGYCTDTDLPLLLAYREYKRIVTLKGDIIGLRYPTNKTLYVLIEEISFNEQAGFTTATSRIYPYKFRLRKVGDADNYKRCTIAQVSYLPHAFSFTQKPVATLPTNAYNLSQSDYDQYTKLMLHCDGTSGSTTILDSSYLNRTVTAIGSVQIDTGVPAFTAYGNAKISTGGFI